jgi:hypothetical protein
MNRSFLPPCELLPHLTELLNGKLTEEVEKRRLDILKLADYTDEDLNVVEQLNKRTLKIKPLFCDPSPEITKAWEEYAFAPHPHSSRNRMCNVCRRIFVSASKNKDWVEPPSIEDHPCEKIYDQRNLIMLDSSECKTWLNQQKDDLCSEQKEVLNLAIGGENVIVKAPGGCGKTHLARIIMADFACKYGSESYIAIAQTNNAAIVLGGHTINKVHQLGILDPKDVYQFVHQCGSEKEMNDRLQEFVAKYFDTDAKKRLIRNARMLLIDEFGRMSRDIFEFLDKLYRLIRECPDKPFGGIQLLMFGDQMQCNTNDYSSYQSWCANQVPPRTFDQKQFEFCFESPLLCTEDFPLRWVSFGYSQNFRLRNEWAALGLRARIGFQCLTDNISKEALKTMNEEDSSHIKSLQSFLKESDLEKYIDVQSVEPINDENAYKYLLAIMEFKNFIKNQAGLNFNKSYESYTYEDVIKEAQVIQEETGKVVIGNYIAKSKKSNYVIGRRVKLAFQLGKFLYYNGYEEKVLEYINEEMCPSKRQVTIIVTEISQVRELNELIEKGRNMIKETPLITSKWKVEYQILDDEDQTYTSLPQDDLASLPSIDDEEAIKRFFPLVENHFSSKVSIHQKQCYRLTSNDPGRPYVSNFSVLIASGIRPDGENGTETIYFLPQQVSKELIYHREICVKKETQTFHVDIGSLSHNLKFKLGPNRRIVAKITQFPLLYPTAITTSVAGGLTLPAGVIFCNTLTLQPGAGYVALSRVSATELFCMMHEIKNLDEARNHDFKCHAACKILEKYIMSQLAGNSDGTIYDDNFFVNIIKEIPQSNKKGTQNKINYSYDYGIGTSKSCV